VGGGSSENPPCRLFNFNFDQEIIMLLEIIAVIKKIRNCPATLSLKYLLRTSAQQAPPFNFSDHGKSTNWKIQFYYRIYV
jgi:hypothetical protein